LKRWNEQNLECSIFFGQKCHPIFLKLATLMSMMPHRKRTKPVFSRVYHQLKLIWFATFHWNSDILSIFFVAFVVKILEDIIKWQKYKTRSNLSWILDVSVSLKFNSLNFISKELRLKYKWNSEYILRKSKNISLKNVFNQIFYTILFIRRDFENSCKV
jgi:hypothetical protein